MHALFTPGLPILGVPHCSANRSCELSSSFIPSCLAWRYSPVAVDDEVFFLQTMYMSPQHSRSRTLWIFRNLSCSFPQVCGGGMAPPVFPFPCGTLIPPALPNGPPQARFCSHSAFLDSSFRWYLGNIPVGVESKRYLLWENTDAPLSPRKPPTRRFFCFLFENGEPLLTTLQKNFPPLFGTSLTPRKWYFVRSRFQFAQRDLPTTFSPFNCVRSSRTEETAVGTPKPTSLDRYHDNGPPPPAPAAGVSLTLYGGTLRCKVDGTDEACSFVLLPYLAVLCGLSHVSPGGGSSFLPE